MSYLETTESRLSAWCDLKTGTLGVGPAFRRYPGQGNVSRCWESHLPGCRDEAVASEKGRGEGQREQKEAKHVRWELWSGCGGKSGVWICNGNFLGRRPLLRTVQGDGEVGSRLLGVRGAAHPEPFPASPFRGHLLLSSPGCF